ncbi:hypothetical protein [Amycolatopsis jiangsuensis]|uniref:Excreted virulence factor EspC (Type VII ESX diderm) n=1 Tax=Amycolatopsis jiangsuensis TaxID=1181879 RepID=A0A840IWI6_9PSEU|nr:hypothetical protein [Amycolatopsis jiangsuensis]MBB4685879.1 hypothetical protein [Amycolatopsis jiangsuensis]
MSGFHVDEGAYERYARQVDPLGDEVRQAAESHLGPHLTLAGDGFSAMGDESGFAGAYGARMRSLHQRLHALGGGWHGIGEAARATQGNFAAVEDEHDEVLRRLP